MRSLFISPFLETGFLWLTTHSQTLSIQISSDFRILPGSWCCYLFVFLRVRSEETKEGSADLASTRSPPVGLLGSTTWRAHLQRCDLSWRPALRAVNRHLAQHHSPWAGPPTQQPIRTHHNKHPGRWLSSPPPARVGVTFSIYGGLTFSPVFSRIQ